MKNAQKIFTSFPHTKGLDPAKVNIVGNPIRRSLLDNTGTKPQFQKPVILVWGGSQGAKTINDFIISFLPVLLKEYDVIHVCGAYSYAGISSAFNNRIPTGYHLYQSLNEVELKNLLPAAAVVVSRAGAGSIFEIAAFGKPSILIPLPASVSTHQIENAKIYAATGAAIMIEQEKLTHITFQEALASCREHTEDMSRAALAFAKPNAARDIAQELMNFTEKL